MEMPNESFEVRALRGHNLPDLSLNHAVKNVSLQRGKISPSVSEEGSLLTLSTEGGINGVNTAITEETEPAFAWKAACETGHVLTELTAAAWYSYILIYFQNVVHLSPLGTGLVFLISQVVRAALTLLVAFQFDNILWRRFTVYGTKKSRHILGSAGILLSWPLIFAPCLFDTTGEPEIGTVAYYLIPVLIFSASWPLVEGSNESFVAESAGSDKQFIGYHLSRSELRHGCTMCLYTTAWILLEESSVKGVDMRTQDQFVRLSLLIVPTGFILVLIFHLAMGDRPSNETEKRVAKDYRGHISRDVPLMTIRFTELKPTILKIWKDWQKHPQFYKIGAVYLCSQNLLYISSLYFPLFLTETLRLPKEAIASYPLIVVIIGYLTTLAGLHATRRLGTKLSLMMAAGMALGASTWFYYLKDSERFLTYTAVVLFSCGSSLVSYAASVLLADLRLMDKQTGANSVGALAFLDRAVLGVVVLLLQLCYPGTLSRHRSLPGTSPAGSYLRIVFSLVPGLNAVVLLVMAAFFLQRHYQGEGTTDNVHEEVIEDQRDRSIRPDGIDRFQGSATTTGHSEDTKPTERTSIDGSRELQESPGLLQTHTSPSDQIKTTKQRPLSDCAEQISNASSTALPTVPPEGIACPDTTTNSTDLTSQASSTVSTCTTTDEIRKIVRRTSSGSSGLQGFYEFPRPATLALSHEDVSENRCSRLTRNDINGAVVHIVTLDINKLRNMSILRAEP